MAKNVMIQIMNPDESDELVCVFVDSDELTADEVVTAFINLGALTRERVEDFYEVQERELQYYIYSPVWVYGKKLERLKNALKTA